MAKLKIGTTISGSIAWHAGNDGAGSGLDADLLDGQQGSYYLNWNNFTNVPTYDNYSSWTISDGSNSEGIASGNTLTVTGTGATSVSYNATTNTLTINSTDTDTNTTYSTATSTTLGLVKIGYTEAGQNYPVELSNGQMYVNVPWTDTNTNQLTTFVVEDGDGTEVTISHGKEWKFVEGSGIDINWTDTDPGSDADPFDLTIGIKGNEIPGSVDLNTYRTTGIYPQNANADASNGTNYPVAQAGILQVINDDYGNGLHTTQLYSQYNSTNYWHRTYYNGTWSAWRNLAQDTNTDTNNYVDGISFNGSGTLTATRSGLTNLTASLASGDITGPLGYTPYQEGTALSASTISATGNITTSTNLQIGGTTVIDSSRNILNINNITAAGELTNSHSLNENSGTTPRNLDLITTIGGVNGTSYSSVVGVSNFVQSSGTATTRTITTLSALDNDVRMLTTNSSASITIANFYANRNRIQLFSSAGAVNVTNLYGTYIEDVGSSEQADNFYGLYIKDVQLGSTNNYGIYVEGGSNYFGGPVEFSDGTNTITTSMLSTDTLSFSGDSGQLFSITDSLSGTIFAVNDISGVPSIEVDDDGTIRLAETFGNVLIGTAVDNGTSKLQVDGDIAVGTSTSNARLLIDKADDNLADHIEFYSAGTKMGEIGSLDTTWLRINQHTAKNIYTPRYIRADAGFFVDGTAKGIDANGNYIGGTITGASDANVANWDTAYGWGNHATAGYLTSETSHADVVVDGDFTSNGLMKRTAAGTYATITDSSANWDTAYGWGNHATAGYLTGITSSNVTTALGYTPYQENTSLTASDILINTTTIVDSSRNLNNIESVNLNYGKRIYFGNATNGTASIRYDNFSTAPNYFTFSLANGTSSSPNGVIYSLNGKNLLIVNGLTTKITLNGNTGDGTFTGNVTAYSDIRLKENILPIDNALDKVKLLRGVTFERTDQENSSRHTGVIAQEVEKVLPEAVKDQEDGYKSVAYGNMVGLLIEAIKEQQSQIDELKAQVQSLKEK